MDGELLLNCVLFRGRVMHLGGSRWSLPVGQLKVEVSVMFLKEPEREEREGTV